MRSKRDTFWSLITIPFRSSFSALFSKETFSRSFQTGHGLPNSSADTRFSFRTCLMFPCSLISTCYLSPPEKKAWPSPVITLAVIFSCTNLIIVEGASEVRTARGSPNPTKYGQLHSMYVSRFGAGHPVKYIPKKQH